MSALDQLASLQRTLPALRGPLGGPLSVEERTLLRQLLSDPDWAWSFARDMAVGGPKVSLLAAIQAVDPTATRDTPPSAATLIRALEQLSA